MRTALLLAFAGLAVAQPVRIGVFSLFKPQEIVVTAVGRPLEVSAEGVISQLEGSQSMTLRGPATVSAREGGPATFVLSIPGKIRRRFQGTLTILRKPHSLEAIITMDREQAVASAVAARSYFAASGSRHQDYDACDSTHCQFLRELPLAQSLAAQATRETAGLVLTYEGKPLAALYSASCGGTTRPLEEPGTAYPYYAVPCEYCQRNRRGIVEGHRYGLCQRGAAGMARDGASFRLILSHYYPGTGLINTLSAFFVASPFRFAS